MPLGHPDYPRELLNTADPPVLLHAQGQLRWLQALRNWLQQELQKTPHLLLMGDFNITFDDADVWDPEGMRDQIHHRVTELAEGIAGAARRRHHGFGGRAPLHPFHQRRQHVELVGGGAAGAVVHAGHQEQAGKGVGLAAVVGLQAVHPVGGVHG